MWTAVGGGASGSNTPNGYVRLSNGLILQWGYGTATTIGAAVLFPFVFPTTCVSVVLGNTNTATIWENTFVYNISKTGFVMKNPNWASGTPWQAIGY